MVLVSSPAKEQVDQIDFPNRVVEGVKVPGLETTATASQRETHENLAHMRGSSGSVDMMRNLALPVKNNSTTQSVKDNASLPARIESKDGAHKSSLILQKDFASRDRIELQQRYAMARNHDQASDKTAGKITLDSAAVNELMQNQELTEHYLNSDATLTIQ